MFIEYTCLPSVYVGYHDSSDSDDGEYVPSITGEEPDNGMDIDFPALDHDHSVPNEDGMDVDIPASDHNISASPHELVAGPVSESTTLPDTTKLPFNYLFGDFPPLVPLPIFQAPADNHIPHIGGHTEDNTGLTDADTGLTDADNGEHANEEVDDNDGDYGDTQFDFDALAAEKLDAVAEKELDIDYDRGESDEDNALPLPVIASNTSTQPAPKGKALLLHSPQNHLTILS